jgi:hydrogenase nickel incorporation protein HypA/HybF
MHEMSIAMELLDQLERLADEHGLARIETVRLEAGTLRGIVPEAMTLAFEAAAAGTRAEGASLELAIVPAEAVCRLCEKRFEPELFSFLCPACGRADVRLVRGNDIILASVTGPERDGKEAK